MRIIAGRHKGRNIFVLPPKKKQKTGYSEIRPTTDFLRENLFNLISDKIKDSVFVDIFAGSGSVGLEAISRGAKSVTFVEVDQNHVNTIKKNLSLLNETANIIHKDAISYLKNNNDKYDIIFIDPPYFKDYENQALELALHSDILNENGIIILQHHKKISLTIDAFDVRKYGINVLSFYR